MPLVAAQLEALYDMMVETDVTVSRSAIGFCTPEAVVKGEDTRVSGQSQGGDALICSLSSFLRRQGHARRGDRELCDAV
jgi:hypothetical protein